MGKFQKRNLLESASLLGESAREDGAWKVRLISEGQGSSGFYSRSLLETYYEVFNDLLSFKNHPTGWDGPQDRDFTMIVGELLGDVWVEDDERGMASICGWYLPDPEYAAKLERYRKKIALSIYAMGEGEFDENTGNFHVTTFESDPYNSVDVVLAGGARGKFLESMRKIHAHRAESSSAPAADAETDKQEGFSEMELKDISEKLDKLILALEASSEASASAALEDAQAAADRAAVESAVAEALANYDTQVAAIEAAGLFPSQVSALREGLVKGRDISGEIVSAQAVAKEARDGASGNRHSESGQFTDGQASTYKFTSFESRK